MENFVSIILNSGRQLAVDDFECVTYPSGNGNTATVKTFNDFYLYDRLLTFVGKSSIVTVKSSDIESVSFSGNFNKDI